MDHGESPSHTQRPVKKVKGDSATHELFSSASMSTEQRAASPARPRKISVKQSGGGVSHALYNLATAPFRAVQSVIGGAKKAGPPAFTALTDLASATVGGKVVFATDEWFATADNLLKPTPPEWKEGVFTECGKWMDGWESRRRRTPGHDFCIIELGCPGIVRGVELDTRYFTGNNAPFASIEGVWAPDLARRIGSLKAGGRGVAADIGKMGTAASEEAIAAVRALSEELQWLSLVPRSALRPGYEGQSKSHFECPELVDETGQRVPVTHIMLSMYPDGGIARLRVHGEVVRDMPAGELTDVAACVNGGVALCWSDQHYGEPKNLLLPGRSPNMGGGWETARKKFRSPVLEAGPDGVLKNLLGSDWAVLKLGGRAEVESVVVDTEHFKGNFPESCLIEYCDRPDILAKDVFQQKLFFEADPDRVVWTPLLPRTKLRAHESRTFSLELTQEARATHLRLTIYPDGGVSRLRVMGRPVSADLKQTSKL